MGFSVNTNAGALFALQALTQTNSQLDITQSRINSGKKVASAKDNAAIFAIAQGQRGELASLRSVKGSLDRASSSINVALAASQAVSDLLIQLKEKATAAADTGADTSSRTKLNDEYQNLLSQIDTVVKNANFNGVNAVNGSSNVQALIALPTGSNTAGDFALTISTTNLTVTSGLSLGATAITTAADASTSLGKLASAETKINTALSKLGAGAKRIDIQRKFTDKLSNSIEIGIGNLVDADLARESANLKALQVRQQLGLQALSIANQAPGTVLSLFR